MSEEEVLPMYVQVARYRLGKKSAAELVPRIEDPRASAAIHAYFETRIRARHA